MMAVDRSGSSSIEYCGRADTCSHLLTDDQHNNAHCHAQFRVVGGGGGSWLVSLMPAACLTACLLQPGTFSHCGPLVIFALQSFAFSYNICNQQLMSTGAIKQMTDTSNKSKNKQMTVSNDSSTWILFSINLMTTFLLYFCVGTGPLLSLMCSCVSLAVQASVCAWHVSEHSRTFMQGEWLTAGQWVSVSITSCLHQLLSPCPPHLTHATCQLNDFVELSVLSCMLLLLLVCMPGAWEAGFLPPLILPSS